MRGRRLALAALVLQGCIRSAELPGRWVSAQDGLRQGSDLVMPADRAEALRDDALSRARVWREPPTPIAEADLLRNPSGADSFPATDEVSCRFHLEASSGLTPKFRCVLAGGEVVKVKYGRKNPETRTELAATRLLAALGFGADRVYVVKKVRCTGCPPYPYPRLPWIDGLLADDRRVADFDEVVIERELEGKRIATEAQKGWAWSELDKVDAGWGGAGRAELDALRLMAVFLNLWDSKPENQRLVCLPGGESRTGDGSCGRPFALMHDLGSAFGPRSLNLEGWSTSRVWADPETCLVSMKSLPYGGASFRDVRISEGGRRFLADRLGRLQERQIRDLFRGARFDEFEPQPPAGRQVDNWVRAFQERVRQLADRPPCPSA